MERLPPSALLRPSPVDMASTLRKRSGDWSSRCVAELDMSKASPLCQELMETKRRMVNASSPNAAGSSPRTDVSSRSDDESFEKLASKNSSPAAEMSHAPETMNAEQRKALRRREQVRAASRRCRDRQRRETEDLRKKVFQLEEFIAHTMRSYEWEFDQKRQQIEELERENKQLSERLWSATHPRSSMADVAHPANHAQPAYIKQDTHPVRGGRLLPPPQQRPSHHIHPHSPEPVMAEEQYQPQWSDEEIYAGVKESTRRLSAILMSPIAPAISRQAFGWKFDIWLEGPYYFAKTRKFFRGMRAVDLAQRMHHIDLDKYVETFHEIEKKITVQVVSDEIQIVRTIKTLPGKEIFEATSIEFMACDEHNENRWILGCRSLDAPSESDLDSENECNGYVFEDTVRTASDGSLCEGCLVQGVGVYESMGKELKVLMEEFAQIMASVVIRWEGLFITDYMTDMNGLADIDLDFQD